MRILTESFCGRALLVILLLLVLLLAAPAASGSESASSGAEKTDKQEILRRVAGEWIEVGMEQYRRAFFKQAEQSFIRGGGCKECLTVAEREQISKLLERTHIAALKRKRILEHIRTANELVERGELIKGKAHLEKVRDSEFLTEQEQGEVAAGLVKLNNQLDEQRKAIAELYDRSVGFYLSGEFEKAREGFIKVARSGLLAAPGGKTAEDYLLKINSILPRQAESEVIGNAGNPAEAGAGQVTKEEGDIGVIDRRINILRSYTRAVVKEAVAKAQNCVKEGKFYRAKEAVEAAERALNENRLRLGEEVFKQYNGELKQLGEEIVEGRKRWLGGWEGEGSREL